MTHDPGPITVLVADDHPLFRAGVAHLLGSAADISVVGQASTGVDALRMILSLKPMVAVVDISMPEMNGIAVVEQASAIGCPSRIAVLSVYEDSIYVQQALAAGAKGYLVKRSTGESLVHAVRAIRSGGLYLDPVVAGRQLRSGDRNGQHRQVGVQPRNSLTQREEEVVRLVAHGFTSKEVATKLGICAKSVETHKARAAEKLGIGSRAKLVQYALLKGWLDGQAH